MKLTDDQIALLPTDDDVAFYDEHGWWISPRILSDDEIDNAAYGAERYYEGERDSPLLVETGRDWTEADGDVLRQNDYVSLQMEELRELLANPIIAASAARLAGTDEIRLFHDQLIYKPAGAEPATNVVGWHTDISYWKTCSSRSMLTAWIPFQDLTEDMGPLVVLDRSFRWQGNDELKSFHQSDLAALEERIETGGDPMTVVPMVMRKGQVSFHHSRTVHASYPNTSQIPRLAFAVHMQDGGNRFQVAHDPATGKTATHINDILVRKDAEGRPDYRDEEICPLLWSGDLSTH